MEISLFHSVRWRIVMVLLLIFLHHYMNRVINQRAMPPIDVPGEMMVVIRPKNL